MFEIDECNYTIHLPDGRKRVFGVDPNVEDFCGFLVKPLKTVDVSSGVSNIAGMDGAAIRKQFMKTQEHVWEIEVIETDPVVRHAMVQAIMDLNIGLKEDLEVTWNDSTGISKRVDNVRVKEYISPNAEPNSIKKLFQVITHAPDPISYSNSEFTNADDEGNAQDLGTETTINFFNFGNCPTYPYFEVTGPFETLKITDTVSGQEIFIDTDGYEWAENEFITIDFNPLTRSVMLNGGLTKYGWLDRSNLDLDWFTLKTTVDAEFQEVIVETTYASGDEDSGQTILARFRSGWY